MEKKSIKISLSTVLLIVAILVIVIMGYCIYKLNSEKKEALEDVVSLSNKIIELNTTIGDLEEKSDTLQNTIDSISSVIGNNSKQNNTAVEMVEEKEKTTTNQNKNESKTDDNNIALEDIIKQLYLDKIKGYVNINNSAKLIDCRVDSVKILKDDEKKEIIDATEGYYETDILAIVTYSVKPEFISEDSVWFAGNGEIQGEWIVNKSACVTIRIGDATGW